MYLNKLKKISKITLIIFMVLQPLFDISFLYSESVRNFFKFSPSTIIRMLFLVFLIGSSYLLIKKNINKKNLGIFIGIYALYSIFHLYNGTLFNPNIYGFQSYSFSKEVFYLIRMICPLLLIFVTYEKDLEFKDIEKIIILVYFIFSFVMVITNIFGVALNSYTTGFIKANIFEWFNPNTYQKYTYEYIASKGLFHMANQISGVMTAFLPLLVYIVLKNKFKLFNIITLFLSILGMMMLGTRIASLGMLMVIIASLIMYLFFKLIKKEKKIFNINVILIIIFLVIGFSLYPYSPVANRVYASSNTESVNTKIKESGALEELDRLKGEFSSLKEDEIKEKEIEFLTKYQDAYSFDELFFIDLYPYQEDPDFWFSLLDMDYHERCDHRQLKTLITKRVFERNNNKLDYLVGYSFSRPRNASIYMENDIYMHLFSIGILGIILFIFPYLGFAIYAFIQILKNKEKFNYLNMTYLFSIALTYLIGLMSGNIFDEWIVTLFLGFITGNLLRNIKGRD